LLTFYFDKIIASSNESTEKPWFIFTKIIDLFRQPVTILSENIISENIVDLNMGRLVEP